MALVEIMPADLQMDDRIEPQRQIAPTPRPRLWHPLRGRDFRLYWGAATLSAAGDLFSYVAVAWLVLSLTSSPLALGSVLMVQAIPRALLMLLGGALADRFSPRATMIASAAGRSLVMAVLAVLVASGSARIWEIFGFSALLGAAGAFYWPSRGSLLPALVRTELLEPANALSQLSQQTAQIFAPIAAGLLVARGGTAVAIAVDAAAYAVCVAGVAFINSPGLAGRRSNLLREIIAGVRYVFADPILRVFFVLNAALNLAFAGSYTVGTATLARSRFPGGAASLGVMAGGFGAGAIVGTVLAGSIRNRRAGLTSAASVAVIGFCLGLLALAPSLALASLLTFGAGLGAGVTNVVTSAWMQRRTERPILGRATSVMAIASFGLQPVSYGLAGSLAQLDVRALLVGGGALMLSATATALLSRAYRTM